jgi:cellulose biosynthesis protein BcsQ
MPDKGSAPVSAPLSWRNVFVSCKGGTGKSTIAGALALVAAGVRKRVLCIEADARALARALGLAREDAGHRQTSARRNELIHGLLTERCEICEVQENLHVDHIRKLADLNRPGHGEDNAQGFGLRALARSLWRDCSMCATIAAAA